MFIQIILFIASLVLFYESPNKYSLEFCTAVFGVFLVSSVLFIGKVIEDKNYFNFHLFFLLSIFFTNFAYPVFIYPADPEYFTIFTFAFDHNLISYGTALSQVAVSSYVLGVLLIRSLYGKGPNTENDYVFSDGLLTFLRGLTIVFTFIFMGHVIYMTKFDPDEVLLNTQLVNLCVIIFTIALLVCNLNIKHQIKGKTHNFVKANLSLISCALIIVLFSLWFGDRGPAIQMFFILMFVFVRFVTQIKLKVFFPLVLFGLFLMTIISYTRGSENNLKSGSIGNTFNEASSEINQFGSFWNYGMDLIINNRNLFVAIEIGGRKEPLYGKSYFPYLFSPVPGLPTLLTENIFGKKPEEFATSTIITKYTGLDWGLGSNAVGDIYMNFHVVGVMAVFFLFGMFIRRIEASSKIYGLLAFTLIFALVIYYPRSSLFEQLSLVVRGIIILYLIFLFSSNPRSIKTHRHEANTNL